MFSLEGKLALVTGGAGSVGRAICLALAEAGADLVIVDTRLLGAQNTEEKVRAFRRFTLTIEMDVSDRERIQEAMREIPEEMMDRTPDILVNAAAISDTWALMEDLDDAQWDRDVDVNLTGVYNMTKAVFPILKEKEWGRIINVSSTAADLGGMSHSSFAATKSALIGFTRSMALEGAQFGVTANAVLPGLIGSGTYYRIPEDQRDRMVTRVPLGYIGEGSDVAALVAFLASPEARYITGTAIPVAGGLGLFNY